MNLAWSGDAVYSMKTAYLQENKYLKYFVPEDGSNIWYDGWVMPKGANEDLAYKFINFISDPANAAVNMSYIGYSSFIASEEVFDYVAYEYGATDYTDYTEYYAEYGDPKNEDEYIAPSHVFYQNEFYKCIKDAVGILPTNTEYFVTYPSAVYSGNVYGVQFHPEKSGEAGLKLLRNFAKIYSQK